MMVVFLSAGAALPMVMVVMLVTVVMAAGAALFPVVVIDRKSVV